MDCTYFTNLLANDFLSFLPSFLPSFFCMQETHSPLSEPLSSVVLHIFSIQQHLLALSKDIMTYLYQPSFLGLERIMSHQIKSG
jgi:hypothetical protein